MIEHVLELSDVVDDLESLPEPDRALAESVLEALDNVDRCARDRMDGVVRRDMPGVTATVRALLAPHHRNTANGYCVGCPQEVEPVWPCPAWRAAHRWMVELDAITGNRHEDHWYLVVES